MFVKELSNMEILYTILAIFCCGLLGYLFGSIPTGIIIGRIHGIDIRQYGSHNTGGTNVGRTLGKKAGITTMVLDIFKCYIPCLITLLVFSYSPLLNQMIDYSHLKELMIAITAIGVLLGHTFPLFAHFKGGKAVACISGYVLFVSPILFAIGITFFFVLFAISKRISVCSIITVPFVALLMLIPMILDLTILNDINAFNLGVYFSQSCMVHLSYITTITMILGAALIVIRHKSNIIRLKNKEEPVTSFKNTINNQEEK